MRTYVIRRLYGKSVTRSSYCTLLVSRNKRKMNPGVSSRFLSHFFFIFSLHMRGWYNIPSVNRQCERRVRAEMEKMLNDPDNIHTHTPEFQRRRTNSFLYGIFLFFFPSFVLCFSFYYYYYFYNACKRNRHIKKRLWL